MTPHAELTKIQYACQTSLTCNGKLNMHNRKPYRTAAQQKVAKKAAKQGKDGVWRAPVPLSYHPKPAQKK